MSENAAAARLTSPLQRQNAHDSADSREDHADGPREVADADSSFAEVSVAEEYEERSEAVRLLPVAGPPRRLVADALHRRNHSVGEQRGAEEAKKDAYRKCSEGNQMSEPPSRKSLSESRGVQLGKIELIPSTETVHRSYTAPCNMESRPYPETLTNTPLGFSMNESMPPMTANEQSTVNITVQFSYPYVTLPDPYQKSENASQPYFVPMILPVQGGKLANAEFLLSEVAKEFDVDVHYATEALAVWMISDLLEVQLKPHHSPYGVGECWASLLKKFTSASADDIAEDTPLVMIKRRVQLSVTREKEIMAFCPRIREILFNDAYEAFMSGRYAPSVEESAELAGFALSAAFEPYAPEKHNVEFLRQEIESFVPRHLVSTIKGPLVFGRALNGPNSLESLLLKSWHEASQPGISLADVHTRFLEKLHNKPYYGAAFFPGSIERPKKKWSLSGGASDINVLVGINETFVSVLDEGKKEILLVQRIKDCTWNRIDPQPSSPDDVEPSLLLTFPDDAPPAKAAKATKVLQIFGRQAVMINALLIAMAAQADEDSMEDDSGAELSDCGGCDYSNSGYSHSVPSTSRSIPLSSSAMTSSSASGASPTSCSPPKTASSYGSSGRGHTTTGSRSAPSQTSSTVSRVPSITRHNKLCLATFDQAGVCLQAQGSLKVVFKGTAGQA
ncbi:hypothetical protein PENTCL1PPCAC_438 [Pristionchus entomophagus]|uniref:FERM domain-containing protein 8 n=1 Tax=Pristionchus entomophagus TaxID=358040 RepID=A0AAV5S8N7_9BILA|nr:hypothetical protein PENTCL1PPCAC_438 [Pristionchus entomophagus]